MGAARGKESGQLGSYRLMGMEFQFGKMKKVLEMDGGEGCTIICYVLNDTERYTQKWLK